MAESKKTHRLTDILTKEVSIVDRPANRRPFLLVKNEGGMPQEIKPDGKGGFVTETPAVEPAVEVPAGLTVTKATREALVSTIEKLTALANSTVEGASDAEGLETSVNEALALLAQPAPLHKAVDGLTKVAPSEVAKAATGCAAKLLEIASALALTTDSEDERYPYSLQWKISQVLEVLAQLARLEAEQPGAAAVVAAAVGVTKSEIPGSDPIPEVVPAVVDEKYTALIKGLQSVLSAELTVDVTKADVDTTELEKLLDQATQVIKAQAARIEKFESAPALSNVLPMEQVVTKAAKKSSGWHADMAGKHNDDEDAQF
jgi:hypothetical protein